MIADEMRVFRGRIPDFPTDRMRFVRLQEEIEGRASQAWSSCCCWHSSLRPYRLYVLQPPILLKLCGRNSLPIIRATKLVSLCHSAATYTRPEISVSNNRQLTHRRQLLPCSRHGARVLDNTGSLFPCPFHRTVHLQMYAGTFGA